MSSSACDFCPRAGRLFEVIDNGEDRAIKKACTACVRANCDLDLLRDDEDNEAYGYSDSDEEKEEARCTCHEPGARLVRGRYHDGDTYEVCQWSIDHGDLIEVSDSDEEA